MILTPIQKLYNNMVNLGKIIVATGFEWLPKVQKIAQSGHTGLDMPFSTQVVSLLQYLFYKPSIITYSISTYIYFLCLSLLFLYLSLCVNFVVLYLCTLCFFMTPVPHSFPVKPLNYFCFCDCRNLFLSTNLQQVLFHHTN